MTYPKSVSDAYVLSRAQLVSAPDGLSASVREQLYVRIVDADRRPPQ